MYTMVALRGALCGQQEGVTPGTPVTCHSHKCDQIPAEGKPTTKDRENSYVR